MRKRILGIGVGLLLFCTPPSTAWQPPGDLELLPVLDEARKGGALAAGERLLERVFQPLTPSHDSPL